MNSALKEFKVKRERVVEILNEEGYFSTGEFDKDGEHTTEYEIFKSDGKKYIYLDDDNNPALNTIYLGNCYIESELYPISYDYRFTGCERGVRAYIIGSYVDGTDEEDLVITDMPEFKKFWFEGNLFFKYVENENDVKHLLTNYEGSYDVVLGAKLKDENLSPTEFPEFGLYAEHTGKITLKEWLTENKMLNLFNSIEEHVSNS